MSAFQVSPTCIDAIVSGIWDYLTDGGRDPAPRYQKEVGPIDLSSRTGLPFLAQALADMNERALAARYGDKPSGAKHVLRLITGLDRVFVIKQMACLLYQCTEGDVDQGPLYKAVEALKGDMAFDVVSRTPAYAAAPWGADDQHVNRNIVSLTDMVRRARG